MLADPETARWAARRRLLPLFPLQGGACDHTAAQIGPGNFGACQTGDYTFSTGSVGIGTTSPAVRLHVKAPENEYALILDSSGTTSADYAGIMLRENGADAERALIVRQPSSHGSLPSALYISNIVGGSTVGFFAIRNNGTFQFSGGNINASGSVVLGGTATRQSSGGPELISFQNKDNNHVIHGTWVRVGVPGAPTLGQTPGGSLAARTYYVKVTWLTSFGESLAGSEASIPVDASKLLTVDNPAGAPATATGFNVYVSTTSGAETKQNASPIPIGDTWTEPTTGLISGAALPTSDTASDTQARHLNSIQGFMEWGAGGTNDQDVALYRTGAGGGLSVQSFNGTASDHAFSVQRPRTADGGEAPVGADLFRVSTESSIEGVDGEVALKSHGDDVSPWAGSDAFQATAAVKTTDATTTTLASLPLTDERAYQITARVVGRKSDGTDRAFFWRAVLAYRQGGTATIQANTVLDLGTIRSNASWACTLDANENDIRVRVTGVGDTTIYWVGTIEYQSVNTDS